MPDQLGFITIRNEDGTQWWSAPNSWGPRCFRRAAPLSEYEHLEARVEETTKNNCPDNGFFGLMNLAFHPCTEAEAKAADVNADRNEAYELALDLGDLMGAFG